MLVTIWQKLTFPSLVLFCLCGCRGSQLRVLHIENPDYPISARFENLQGTVEVKVNIGPNGKVEYAKGSGAPDVLVKAAEENAQTWTFGPFPSVFEFPAYHTIEYVYRLDPPATVVAIRPTIKTSLPNRIEISATPLVSDYPPITSYRPLPEKTRKRPENPR